MTIACTFFNKTEGRSERGRFVYDGNIANPTIQQVIDNLMDQFQDSSRSLGRHIKFDSIECNGIRIRQQKYSSLCQSDDAFVINFIDTRPKSSLNAVMELILQVGIILFGLIRLFIYLGQIGDNNNLTPKQQLFIKTYWLLPSFSVSIYVYMLVFRRGYFHNQCTQVIMIFLLKILGGCVDKKTLEVDSLARYHKALAIRRVFMSAIITVVTEPIIDAWNLESEIFGRYMVGYYLLEFFSLGLDYWGHYRPWFSTEVDQEIAAEIDEMVRLNEIRD